MACPKKFADLHKGLDDAFGKDFCHGAFNVEIKQGADAGDFGKGSLTMKVNHNPLTGGTNSNLEGKVTCGEGLGPLKDLVLTRSINDAGLVKVKAEKACSAGSKTTYDFDFDLNTKSNKKANLDILYGCDKATMGLKVVQGAGAIAAPTSVVANAVAKINAHNFFGANVDYNLSNGAIGHHFKVTSNQHKAHVSVGLKDADNVGLYLTHHLDQPLCCGPFGTLNISKVHAKADYGIKAGSYGVNLCLEGKYALGDFNTIATKMAYNPLSGDFKESHKFAITPALSANVSFASNAHKGLFNNASMGATLNFSV